MRLSSKENAKDCNIEAEFEDEDEDEEEEEEDSLEQSGLAQLQTLAGDECNEDWIQYQESLAVLQVCE
jgi:hypothetical protein